MAQNQKYHSVLRKYQNPYVTLLEMFTVIILFEHDVMKSIKVMFSIYNSPFFAITYSLKDKARLIVILKLLETVSSHADRGDVH